MIRLAFVVFVVFFTFFLIPYYRFQRLRELSNVAKPISLLHAQEISNALQLIAVQPRQMAAVVEAAIWADLLVMGVGQDDAATEHDVEEDAVRSDDAPRPGKDSGAAIINSINCFT